MFYKWGTAGLCKCFSVCLGNV